MRRRLPAIVEALSLVLFLAACVLWVRSYWRWDLAEWVPRAGWAYSVYVTGGSVDFSGSAELPGVTSDWTTEPAPPGARVRWFGGFRFDFADDPAWLVRVPLWFPAALAAAAWACAARAQRRRRPHPPGRCPACGYDLRATPERCPECGTAVGITA